MTSDLIITGAREHNLKDISLSLPRDRFIVITGLSGSGKSSLAFDTIYAEGQRRYVESLSAYARQFLGQMDKPDVDSIEGLSPAISIDQKTTSRNPRSTVGTVTEIYDYLRLLYARVGHPHCPNCGRPISGQSVQQIVDHVCELEPGTRFSVVAPVVRGRKGEYGKLFEQLRADGFTRVKVDGDVRELEEDIDLDKKFKHDIAVVVDRLVMKDGLRRRLTDSVETAGVAGRRPRRRGARRRRGRHAHLQREVRLRPLRHLAARDRAAHLQLQQPARRLPGLPRPRVHAGDRPRAGGAGRLASASTRARCCPTASSRSAGSSRCSRASPRPSAWTPACRGTRCPRRTGTCSSTAPARSASRSATATTRGACATTTRASPASSSTCERRFAETESEQVRQKIEEYMADRPCPECKGARLKPTSLAVTVGERNIHQFTLLSVREALAFLDGLSLSDTERLIGSRVIKEIGERLRFLNDVGVGYLSLQRASATLSGGEAQRIRLATQIGSALVGVLYILDEPSIGLHQRDNRRLIDTLLRLRDLGNTVLVVEHDEETMRLGRPHRRHGARRRRARRPRGGPGHAGGGHGRRGVAHRRLPRRAPPHRAARPAAPAAAVVHRPRRAHAQPQGHRRLVPGRRLHLRHRRLRLRQVHARQRDPLQGHGGAPQPRHQAARRRPRRHRRRTAPRQGHRHRPVAHRPHAAQQPGHLHRRVRPHPPALRADAREQAARLQARPLQLQRQGRPLRDLQGRRADQDRDALPARRVRALRGLPAASATTATRSRSGTRARTSPRCSR